MLLSSFMFALLGGGKFSYFVFYFVSLGVIILFLWTKSIVDKLDFSQRMAKDYAYVGDEVEIKTMVYNESLLPVPCIEIRNGMIKNISGIEPSCNIVSLSPLDSRSIIEKFKCRYRGYYTFGPVTVDISDIFGLFTWEKTISCEGILSVYPRVARLEKFNVRPMQIFGNVSTKQNVNEDFSSISDIRKYYPGDSFKKIHWKVSARKGSLYVKNYEMSGSAEAYIFLNLFQNDYNNSLRPDLEEKAVECSASIVYYMLEHNINTGLYSNGKDISYTRGRDLKEFKKFMEVFITVKSNGIVPVEELLESRARLMQKGSSIILITPDLNERLLDRITQLNRAGFDVTLVFIRAEDLKEKHKKTIDDSGIKLYCIGIGDDVKTSLEG